MDADLRDEFLGGLGALAVQYGFSLFLRLTHLAGELFNVMAGVRAIVDGICNDVRKVVQMPDIRERFTALNLEPVGSTPEEFAQFLKDDLQKYARIAKGAKIEPQ